MIEHFYNLGEIYLKREGFINFSDLAIKSWMNQQKGKIDNSTSFLLMNINTSSMEISTQLVPCEAGRAQEHCFFTDSGNSAKGGGFYLSNKIKKSNVSNVESLNKKVTAVFNRFNKSLDKEQVKKVVERVFKEKEDNDEKKNKILAVLFCIDGMEYRSIVRDILDTDLDVLNSYRTSEFSKNKIRKKYTHCSYCSKITDELYDRIGFDPCSNNTGNFGHNDTIGSFIVCKECLRRIVLGIFKAFDTYSVWWCGQDILILPHMTGVESIDNQIIDSFERIYQVDGKAEKLLSRIKGKEVDLQDILNDISGVPSFIDFVFYKNSGGKKSVVSILSHVIGVSPSRFAYIHQVIHRLNDASNNKFSLLMGAINVFSDMEINAKKKYELAKGDKRNLLKAILKKLKINNDHFISNVIMSFEARRRENLSEKTKKLEWIYYDYHRVCCFLDEIGCLDFGGMRMHKQYESMQELFDDFPEAFKNHGCRAWFALGQLYNLTSYYEKIYHDTIGKGKSSSLDRDFILSEVFHNEIFVKIMNKITDKLRAYDKIRHKYMQEQVSYIRDCDLSKNKMNADIAKQMFYYGYSSYFKKIEEEKEKVLEEENKE